MTIYAILAHDLEDGIGMQDGRIPWYIPEDLQRFKKLTMGATVIMGRRTFDSLPPKVRPLPGRRNVVITRDPEGFIERLHHNAPFSTSPTENENKHKYKYVRAMRMEEAEAWLEGERGLGVLGQRIFIIGGAEIWNQLWHLVEVVYTTRLYGQYGCDVRLPSLSCTLSTFSRMYTSGVQAPTKTCSDSYDFETWGRGGGKLFLD